MHNDILKRIDDRREFTTCDDGFVYYWPGGCRGGELTAANLRIIADELDRRNEAWAKQIDEYLGGKPCSPK